MDAFSLSKMVTDQYGKFAPGPSGNDRGAVVMVDSNVLIELALINTAPAHFEDPFDIFRGVASAGSKRIVSALWTLLFCS